MKCTPEQQAKQDREHLLAAHEVIQNAHAIIHMGNPKRAQELLAVGSRALHAYLKATTPHPEETPEGIEEVAG